MTETAPSTKLRIALADGSHVEVEPGTPVASILTQGPGGAPAGTLAASWNGAPVDLAYVPRENGSLAPLTFADRAGWEILQHSSAHLVAKALVESVPGALPRVGPPTDDGFHYDFDVRPLTPPDLDAINSAIARSIQGREKFLRRELSREEARSTFASNPYKLRIIDEAAPGEPISVYDTGGFTDLCRGPHVPDTGWLAGVHILGFSAITSEAADGRPLQRVRGVGFPTRKELEAYLKLRAEAEARDHRTIGQRQELFFFSERSPGFPFWLPNGMVIVRELEKFVSEHLRKAGYSEIRTPLLFHRSVFETSGHWEHYKENMFLSEVDEQEYGWKPMNCPGAMLIFGSRPRSYRELPLRLAEFAPLHRLEASGTLHGLMRVRELVQDDAHIFVTEDEIASELRGLLDWIREACATFRLDYSCELSTRPASFLGASDEWDRAEELLAKAVADAKVPSRRSPGEGAFYAPKIDFHLRDSLGRPWQNGTIQLDFQMPRRFGLEYQGADGKMHTPAVIHRTILGTWERFTGVLIEHLGGRWPPWLAPVQVSCLPVAERHAPAARGFADELIAAGLRVELSGTEETLPKRVRAAELARVPYIAVIGDRETADGSVAVRLRGSRESRTMSRPEFVTHVAEKVRHRAFDP